MCNILRGGGKLFYLTLKKMKAIHIITALALALSYPPRNQHAPTRRIHKTATAVAHRMVAPQPFKLWIC